MVKVKAKGAKVAQQQIPQLSFTCIATRLCTMPPKIQPAEDDISH